MSQQLTPINGGVVPEVQTTVTPDRLNVLSQQYVGVNDLASRPTEWVPDGRPIYRRLPATSESYQVDFFNLVVEAGAVGNTFVADDIEEVGYVFVPYGESTNGETSLQVSVADSKETLLIKSGTIVWKYGRNKVLPTIVDLSVVDVLPGSYQLAYQLVYDDSPVPSLYRVSDYSLEGMPLTITSSTDAVVGWRRVPVNAFLTSSTRYWSNEDNLFTDSPLPSPYLQWESELTQAYSKMVLRCPPESTYSGTATLYYVSGTSEAEVLTVPVSSDSVGKFFEFDIEEPVLQTGWKVSFSGTTVSIESIKVDGNLTLLEAQAIESPRAALALYPTGTLPKKVLNISGEEVPANYCQLAIVEVGKNYEVLKVSDTRSIVSRDYVPVADWLTTPFDEDLINLYEQVSDYSTLWMAPESALKQEYLTLSSEQIEVEV